MPDDASRPDADWVARAAQILPTEHFTLQGARAATISESTGRASMYLATVSSGLVALGFIGQSTAMGAPFDVFALVLLPTIFFLGLTTLSRVTQSGVEDLLYGRGINRIRGFYLEYVPEAAPYFILDAHDDVEGVLRNMGIVSGRRQMFLTVGGMISVINSVVAGACVGLLISLFEPPLAVSVGGGAAAFGLSVVAHFRLEEAFYANPTGDLTVRNPSNPADPDAANKTRSR